MADFLEIDEELLDDEQPSVAQRYEHFRVVADRGQTLMRVDRFLIEHRPNTSRSRIQRAADAGMICANGKPVKSNYRVHPFDVITLEMDRQQHETRIEPENIPLDIVYEDDDLMVVNKPAGMVVHPGCGNFHGTLIHAVAWHMKDHPEFDPNSPDVGLCHRIDKDTSGLLLIAKTPEAKTDLCRQFFYHTTRREYNALVWGHFSEDSGTVEGNIGRDPKDRLRMAWFAPDSGVGKEAVTHWQVLERLAYVTLVACRLETGRTHQIRVHMAHEGHILFNDERYGGNEILRGQQSASYKAFINNCFALCPRQALHARTLGFRHPRTGLDMDFACPLPADMAALIDKWRRYVSVLDGSAV